MKWKYRRIGVRGFAPKKAMEARHLDYLLGGGGGQVTIATREPSIRTPLAEVPIVSLLEGS